MSIRYIKCRSISDIFIPEKVNVSGCQCQPCVEQRKRIEKREKGSLLNPKLSKKCVAVAALIGSSDSHTLSYTLQDNIRAIRVDTPCFSSLQSRRREIRQQNLRSFRNSGIIIGAFRQHIDTR